MPRKMLSVYAFATLVAGASSSAASAAGDPMVVDVKFWSLGDVTRIAVEVSGGFKFNASRLTAPERIFFDLRGVHLRGGRAQSIPVEDGVVRQIRLAENTPGTARVVLDLDSHAEFVSSQLAAPHLLMIEVRNPVAPPRTLSQAAPPAPPPVTVTSLKRVTQTPKPLAPPAARPRSAPAPATIALLPPVLIRKPGVPQQKIAKVSFPGPPARRQVVPHVEAAAKPGGEEDSAELAAVALAPAPHVMADRSGDEGRLAAPAKRGSNSLTRALGLKVRRIVLDAGHGGKDEGTSGYGGLTEKDFVLDVVLRLGALLRDRLGSEVIYTRAKDAFVPLERRSEIANQARADLFLSVHANSSPVRAVSGVETYYLSFTTTKPALEVAARENATAERSVSDLRDLVQQIMLRDKVDESRELALKVQSSLFGLSAKANAAARNRGVKKAPFVVLIGASMPAALAEIGFITNSKDEAMFKKPEHRQKIAESLYHGIAQYADSLSHFQVAKGSRTPLSE